MFRSSIFIAPEVNTADPFVPACEPRDLEAAQAACVTGVESGELYIVDTPVVNTLVSRMGDKDTAKADFTRCSDLLGTILIEAAVNLGETSSRTVTTPNNVQLTSRVMSPNMAAVYVPRAGICFMEGVKAILPDVPEGFVGATRDEATLVASTYGVKLPESLKGLSVLALDLMLATGGSLDTTIDLLLELDPESITVVSMFAAPEGIQRLLEKYGERPDYFKIVTTLIHWGLNKDGFIVPGLGDAGNRRFGVTPE